MEEMAMQSSIVELGIWEVFVQSRVSISIIFLGNVISILIAVWPNCNQDRNDIP